MSFLKISNFRTEDKTDKLSKAKFLLDYIRRKCRRLYQPEQNISIDERMVKNKGRYNFRMFMKDKPTKWGMKLWVLADSRTGYTYNFDVYEGKGTLAYFGSLAYQVVMRLLCDLFGQGYHLFVDNFYTSVDLFRDLVDKGVRACGTVLANRRGFPVGLKNVKEWEKGVQRGESRWERDGDILAMQWKDNKTVSFLSTIHEANKQGMVHRRSKNNGVYTRLNIPQPDLVKSYNQNMGGVDQSDQHIAKNTTLRKTHKWWKSLFYHCIDIAKVNSYILFKEYARLNPDIPALQRPSHYNKLDFSLELARQLAGIGEYEEPPIISNVKKTDSNSNSRTSTPVDCSNGCKSFDVSKLHLPDIVPSNERKNCVLCYAKFKKEQKTRHKCMTCNKFLCLQEDRMCFRDFHLSM